MWFEVIRWVSLGMCWIAIAMNVIALVINCKACKRWRKKYNEISVEWFDKRYGCSKLKTGNDLTDDEK